MKSLSGFFIHPTEEEEREIWNACALHGFPLTSAGILQLLMLAVHPPEEDEDEDAPPSPMEAVVNHLAQNPEQAAVIKEAGAKLMRFAMGKLKPKAGP